MLLMGHRGARDQGPENTLKAFRAAADCGLKVVELDVHASKDGVLMVHHDDTLERTTTGKGFLREYTVAELQQFTAGENEKIPTLAEVLEFLLNRDIQVQVEIKSPEVLNILSKELTPFRAQWPLITLISFDHSWLLKAKNILPEIKTVGLLFGTPVEVKSFIQAARLSGLSLSVHWITPEICKEIRSLGGSITCWNANDLATLKKAHQLQVDHVGTDVPLKTQPWLEEILNGHQTL